MSQHNSIDDALRAYVDAGTLAGAATLVWRNGRVVQTAIVGRRDLMTNLPVERSTIFRIASMTKPLTTVAALTLYDEGRFALDEPITRLAPELARLRVLRDPNGPLEETDATERPITFGDLLTHRSGLTYGELHRGPISCACAQALGGTMDNALSPGLAFITDSRPTCSDSSSRASRTHHSATSWSGASSGRWACAIRVLSSRERSALAARASADSTPRGSWPPW